MILRHYPNVMVQVGKSWVAHSKEQWHTSALHGGRTTDGSLSQCGIFKCAYVISETNVRKIWAQLLRISRDHNSSSVEQFLNSVSTGFNQDYSATLLNGNSPLKDLKICLFIGKQFSIAKFYILSKSHCLVIHTAICLHNRYKRLPADNTPGASPLQPTVGGSRGLADRAEAAWVTEMFI